MSFPSHTAAVILAAGKGTRMKADSPKVLFPVQGRPLIEFVLDAVDGVEPVIVIVGYQHEKVRDRLQDRAVHFALQEEQLGTGHAAMQAVPLLEGREGTVVVLAGDVPLIRRQTLLDLVERHHAAGAAVTVLTAVLEDATGYGRIVRGDHGVQAIVEHKDCTPEQLEIKEMNSSIYAFDIPFLLRSLPRLGNRNQQGEYYLTDTVAMAVEEGLLVEGVICPDFAEVSGVNTREQLQEVDVALRARGSEA